MTIKAFGWKLYFPNSYFNVSGFQILHHIFSCSTKRWGGKDWDDEDQDTDR